MTSTRILIDHYGHWWAVLTGEVLDGKTLEDAASEVSISDDRPLIRTVKHLSYMPRVKWCGNHGGSCDMEGEWHGHWFPVRPGASTAHTLVRFGRAS